MPKNMHIYLLIILFFCFSFEGAICKPSSTSSDLATEIEGRLDLGNHNVEQTTVILARDYPGEYSINQVAAIYDAMRTGWYYYSDPSYREAYKSANQTLQEGKIAGTLGVGDCEDFAILISSLVGSLGGSTRITFAYNEETRQGHAYSELYLGKKDNPMVEDLKGWIKEKYGVPSIPGLSLAGDEIWLNLDYNSSHLGGPFFDEGGAWVQRQKVWEAGNKTSPKIVPAIDNMDELGRWKVLRDGIGSKAEISLVPARQGKAINLSYDLKENGFVGISEEVDPKLLSEVRGLNLSYLLFERQRTLEIRLKQDDGAIFKSSQVISGGKGHWSTLQILFEDLQANDPILSDHKIDLSRTSRLEIKIVNDPESGERTGPGFVVLNDLQGVMNVPKGSPWERAKEQNDKSQAIYLASQSDLTHEIKLDLSILLAIESLKIHPTLQGDLALRQGLDLFTGLSASLKQDGPIIVARLSPDGTKIATASKDNTARVWDISSGSELMRFEHERGPINDVIFSPEGTKIATAGQDNTARIWDISSGKELTKLQLEGPAVNIDFSSDGNMVATASYDGTDRIWNASSGTEVARMTHSGEYLYGGMVNFSPDGRLLVTHNGNYTAGIFDTISGKELPSLKLRGSGIKLAFSPDSKRLAITGGYGVVLVFDTITFQELLKLETGDVIFDLAFSPNGERIVTSGRDNTARIWDSTSGKELMHLIHAGFVYQVVFSPDGKKIATAGEEGIVRIWDIANGEKLASIEHGNIARIIGFNTDGKKIVLRNSHNRVQIWEMLSGKERTSLRHNDSVHLVIFSPDSECLATGSSDGTARIWNVTSGNEIAKFTTNYDVSALAFHPDGSRLAVAGYGAALWDIHSGNKIFEMDHGNNLVYDVTFSADGSKIATACIDNFVRVSDAFPGRGRKLLKLEHGDYVHDVDFSPDGTKVASASADGTARIWDVSSGKELVRLKHDGDPSSSDSWVLCLTFSPDGTKLATAGGDNTARIWEVASGKELARFEHDADVSRITFSPDGTRLATVSFGNIARVWDVSSGKEIAQYSLSGRVRGIIFSPDGKYLAACGGDHTARVWNINSGEEISRLTHDDTVSTIAFSPNGKWLATGSNDKTARIWRFTAEGLIEEACNRLQRSLTPEEWRQYLGDEPYRETCPCKDCKSGSGG